MRIIMWVLVFLALGGLPSFAKDYRLGDTTLVVTKKAYGNAGLTYVNVHRNEDTSIAAAKAVLKRYGGRLVTLDHPGGRNVSFTLDGRKYEFDPNRMFSPAGLAASLKNFGAYSEEAQKLVFWFATEFIFEDIKIGDKLKPRVLVALHNNTDGNFSVNSYESGPFRREAAKVHVNPAKDPDDFFLVTNERVFNHLKRKGYNVVLQTARPANDGSLSVFAPPFVITYINVEAQSGHLAEQIKMLTEIAKMRFR